MEPAPFRVGVAVAEQTQSIAALQQGDRRGDVRKQLDLVEPDVHVVLDEDGCRGIGRWVALRSQHLGKGPLPHLLEPVGGAAEPLNQHVLRLVHRLGVTAPAGTSPRRSISAMVARSARRLTSSKSHSVWSASKLRAVIIALPPAGTPGPRTPRPSLRSSTTFS
ncbi:MAG: hypothetical protein IPN02_05910 [Candidatus Microthrix sp.]|uniref:Uncharacterized protein n=1 Tax=Candidatus Neomicrothrix subdominans TaxID=2954438 RepID=A0A936N9Z0_9ACTN|nr:hypothetical protein [Candidatus Microthrix subdominans]